MRFIVLAGVCFLFMLSMGVGQVHAQGGLFVTCNTASIHSSLKSTHQACERPGSALPGDVIVLQGVDFTPSSRQAPVNIDQEAIFQGNGVTLKSRIYSVFPKTPLYSTEGGIFVANTVVPLGLKEGRYTVSFDVRMFGCNKTAGPRDCGRERAEAILDVLPTALGSHVYFSCPAERLERSYICEQGSAFRLSVAPVRANKNAQVFIYFVDDKGKVVFQQAVSAGVAHDIQTKGQLGGLLPGAYSIIVRNRHYDVKIKTAEDWEIRTSPGFTIRKKDAMVTSVTIVKPIQPVHPPAQTKVKLGKISSPVYAISGTNVRRKDQNSLAVGGRFELPVQWVSGQKFIDHHYAKLLLGVYEKGVFKTVHPLGSIEVTEWWQYRTLDPATQTYTFVRWVPETAKEGTYVLRVVSDESDIHSPHYYVAERQVFVEKVKVFRPSVVIPTTIRPGESIRVIGKDFPPGSTVEAIQFSDPNYLDPSISISVSSHPDSNGSFESLVEAPSDAHAVIRRPIDEKGKELLSQEGAHARLRVRVLAKDENSVAFSAEALTALPLTCQKKEDARVEATGNVIDQSLKNYSVKLTAVHFSCWDPLVLQVHGLKVNGKKIPPEKSNEYFYWNETLKADKDGLLAVDVFNLISMPPIDADVTELTFAMKDRHGIQASVRVGVRPKYDVRLEQVASDSAYQTLVLKGFAVPGPRVDIVLENAGLLGSRNPLTIKTVYLDASDKNADGDSTVSISRSIDAPSGTYVLRVIQGSAFALTSYVIQERKREDMKTPEQEKIEKIIRRFEPCGGLEGYMLRACRQSYGLSDNAPIQEDKKEEGTAVCGGLEGYFLRQCRRAYGLDDAQTNVSPLEEKKTDQKKDEIIPPVEKETEQKESIRTDLLKPVTYCSPDLPKIWQEGCVPPPTDQKTEERPVCNLSIPKYSQPNCREQ